MSTTIFLGKARVEALKPALMRLPGRGLRHACGRRAGSPLYAADVRRIRKVFLARDPRYGAAALAEEYGVSAQTIRNVAQRKTWGHLP